MSWNLKGGDRIAKHSYNSRVLPMYKLLEYGANTRVGLKRVNIELTVCQKSV